MPPGWSPLKGGDRWSRKSELDVRHVDKHRLQTLLQGGEDSGRGGGELAVSPSEELHYEAMKWGATTGPFRSHVNQF